MRVGFGPQPVQRRLGVGPRIAQHGRPCSGQGARGRRRSPAAGNLELTGGVELEELGVEVAGQREVEPVEPGHRFVGVVPVVVPGVGRREHQISRRHGADLAVDRGPRPRPFHHEAERRRAVPVARRRLVGAEELHRSPQGGRGAVHRIAVGLDQAGVDGRQHPAVAAPVDGHELARHLREAGEILVAPQPGLGPGPGFEGHDPGVDPPQRFQVVAVELGVEVVEGGVHVPPFSLAAMSSRSFFLSTLPTLVTGRASTISSRSGHLNRATPRPSR